MRPWRLVADVGGSNVRFARAHQQHALGERSAYPLSTYASFYDALTAFLDETKGAEGCASAAIGVAGPIDGDSVKVTNAPWTIKAGEVARSARRRAHAARQRPAGGGVGLAASGRQ